MEAGWKTAAGLYVRIHVEFVRKTAGDLYVRIHVEGVRKTAADQGERIRGVAARKKAVDKSVTIHEEVKGTAADQLVHKGRVIAEVDLAAAPIEGETGKRGRRE